MDGIYGSFLAPVLLSKTISKKPDFSLVDELFQESLQQPLLIPSTAGSILVCNRSQTKFTCQGENINPGMTALFARLFTSADANLRHQGLSSQPLEFESSLLLNDEYGTLLATNGYEISSGINRIVTVMSADENTITSLISKFQCDQHKYLLRERKKFFPELDRYSNDPDKYVEELKTRSVFIVKTMIHSQFQEQNTTTT